MTDANEQSIPSRGSHGSDVSAMLDAIGDCLSQVDPFDPRCIVCLSTPERRKAHKALWQLRKMLAGDCLPAAREWRVSQDHCGEIAILKEAIRRIAERDATLSVHGGNVVVTMDATLTDEEREALGDVAAGYAVDRHAATIRRLLERTK
jgi:hypothetical protein